MASKATTKQSNGKNHGANQQAIMNEIARLVDASKAGRLSNARISARSMKIPGRCFRALTKYSTRSLFRSARGTVCWRRFLQVK